MVGEWATRCRQRLGSEPERGSLTLFAALFTTAMLMMAGLVVDGGARLTAQRSADHQAEQAARAGAQAVNAAGLRAGTHVVLDPAGAREAALTYLRAAGHPGGTVTVSGGAVNVAFTQTQPTAILGVVGVSSFSITGSGHARLLHGIGTEEG